MRITDVQNVTDAANNAVEALIAQAPSAFREVEDALDGDSLSRSDIAEATVLAGYLAEVLNTPDIRDAIVAALADRHAQAIDRLNR